MNEQIDLRRLLHACLFQDDKNRIYVLKMERKNPWIGRYENLHTHHWKAKRGKR